MARMMRMVVTTMALLLLCASSQGQDEKKKAPPRFGFELDEVVYPQQSPAAAMKSVVTAFDRKRVDYLLAQIADPAYVDFWVDRYKVDFPKGKEEGKRLLAFDRLVRETNDYFQNDPLLVKELRIFAKEAKWADEGDVSVGTTEKIPARKVFFRKIGDRWFLENKQQ
jgi:hypothetical protein